MKNFISINIIYTRNLNRLSQKDIAKMFEVTQTTLSNYETGKNEPTLMFVIKFCKEFNLSIDDFVNIDLSKRPEVRKDYVAEPVENYKPLVEIEKEYKQDLLRLEKYYNKLVDAKDDNLASKENEIYALKQQIATYKAFLNQNGFDL